MSFNRIVSSLASLALLAGGSLCPRPADADVASSRAETSAPAQVAQPASEAGGLGAFLVETGDGSGKVTVGRRVSAIAGLGQLPTLRLEGLGEMPLIAERSTILRTGGEDFVWSGSLLAEPFSRVTLASRNGVLAGVIDRPLPTGGNEALVIEPQPDGSSVLMRANDLAPAASGCAAIPVVLPRGGRVPKDDTYPPATASNPAVIDVMILYTPASRARYGASGIQAKILQGVADANTAYQRSQIFITLNLVHMAEVNYTETGDMLAALVALVSLDDGKLDEAHVLRAQHGADLVVLVDEDGNYAGISYMMGTPTTAFAPYAFSVVGSGFISSCSMHHEMGHNMGCNHDHASASGGGSYPYSYGFQRCAMDGTGVRTVMSYPCPSAYASRINYFSNPNVLYNGRALGVAYETDPVGASDNARSLNLTAHYVEAFFSRPAPLPSAPTSLAATTAGPQQVNLSWTRTGTNETGFKVERASAGVAWAEIATLPTGSVSYADNGLAPSTAYSYRVRAYNGSGASDYSNEAVATTPEAAPAAPSGLLATVLGANVIALNWVENATNETSLRVERSSDSVSWTELAVLPANAAAYTDASLAPASAYTYRVRACNDTGCSAYSAGASAATLPLPPTAPTHLQAALLGNCQVSLTWENTSTNLTCNRVECSAAGGAWVEVSSLCGTATTCDQSGLQPNTSYAFRVRSANAGGFSPYSEAASVATPEPAPGAPGGLTVVSTTASAITLVWTDGATNESTFRLQRSSDSVIWTDAAVLPANSTTCTDSGLTPGTTFHYRLQACHATGCSAFASVDGTTLPLPPAAPTGLTATANGCAAATVTWASEAGADGFLVECSENGGGWVETASLPGNSIGCNQGGLTPAATYAFRVRAFNAGGISAYSQIVSVTMPQPIPAPAANLTATALSATAIGLTWEDLATNESEWRVESSADQVNWQEVALLPANSVSWQDTGLAPASTRYYRVRACNSTDCSAYCDIAGATTLPLPPSAPQNCLASVISGSQLAVTWLDTSTTETAFIIERSLDGATFSLLTVVAANTTAYTDSGLTSCQTYYYRVLASNAGGNSAPANIASATPLAGAAPSAPSNLAASTLSSSSIKLTWRDNSTDETAFQVERSLDGVNFGIATTLPAQTVAWTNDNLVAATKYYYRVRAVKACQSSAPTSVVSSTTQAAPPPAPSALVATAGASGTKYITVTWTDNATTETAQYLQQSTDGVTWKALVTLSANVTSYRNTGLVAGKTYYYRVRAYNSAGGYSAFSNIGSAPAR